MELIMYRNHKPYLRCWTNLLSVLLVAACMLSACGGSDNKDDLPEPQNGREISELKLLCIDSASSGLKTIGSQSSDNTQAYEIVGKKGATFYIDFLPIICYSNGDEEIDAEPRILFKTGNMAMNLSIEQDSSNPLRILIEVRDEYMAYFDEFPSIYGVSEFVVSYVNAEAVMTSTFRVSIKQVPVPTPVVDPGTDPGSDPNPGTSSEPITGTVMATVSVSTSKWDSYLSWVNGKTDKITYIYYPSTGKYEIYGGIYDRHPEANGGKGLVYDAHKGRNKICIDEGIDRDYSSSSVSAYYSWYVYLNFTLP